MGGWGLLRTDCGAAAVVNFSWPSEKELLSVWRLVGGRGRGGQVCVRLQGGSERGGWGVGGGGGLLQRTALSSRQALGGHTYHTGWQGLQREHGQDDGDGGQILPTSHTRRQMSNVTVIFYSDETMRVSPCRIHLLSSFCPCISLHFATVSLILPGPTDRREGWRRKKTKSSHP